MMSAQAYEVVPRPIIAAANAVAASSAERTAEPSYLARIGSYAIDLAHAIDEQTEPHKATPLKQAVKESVNDITGIIVACELSVQSNDNPAVPRSIGKALLKSEVPLLWHMDLAKPANRLLLKGLTQPNTESKLDLYGGGPAVAYNVVTANFEWSTNAKKWISEQQAKAEQLETQRDIIVPQPGNALLNAYLLPKIAVAGFGDPAQS